MSTKTKYVLATCASVTILTLPLLAGAQFLPDRGVDDAGLSDQSAYDLLINIMKQALVFLTILGVLGFIISGIIYITAGGAGKADTAQKWLQYSILGIIIGLIGYIVIRLISNVISGNIQS